MKRFASFLLAATMLMSTPAFAAAPDPVDLTEADAVLPVVDENSQREISTPVPPISEATDGKAREDDVTVSARRLIGSVYQIAVDGAASAERVQIPSWTKVNGQDDVVWYEAHRQDSGVWTCTINTSRHGGGAMVSHVYVDGVAAGRTEYSAPVPDYPGVLALPRISSIYTILVSNLDGTPNVTVEMWNVAAGEEHAFSCEATNRGNGVWSAHVNTALYGGGSTICRVYADGEQVGSVSFRAPQVVEPTISTQLLNGTRYSIILENLYGVSRVQIPTWAENGNQDDIIWYEAENTAPGVWQATLNAANHDEGVIVSHIYADERCLDEPVRVTRSFAEVRDAAGNTSGVSAEALSSLSRKADGWGPGVRVDDRNRPEGATEYQERFGQYDADFIAPDSDRIFLTFDEGYEAGYTSRILDVLKEKNVKAIFFVTYPYVLENPDLVQRMIDEGHQVGNHSWKHVSMPQQPLNRAFDEVMQVHTLMQKQFDYEMTVFRFPEGEFSERDLALLQSLGYRSAFWSFAYRDWDPAAQMGTSAAWKKVTKAVHPGAIYLLHAVSRDNASILSDFIDYCREQGYELAQYGDMT